MLNIFLIAALFHIGFAKNTATLPDGFNHQKPFSISVITEEKSNELFQQLKKSSQELFSNDTNVCHIRATKLAQLAEAQKIYVGKIFARGTLRIKSPGAKVAEQKFDWHVAPVIYVQPKDGGKPILQVLDPQFFDQPISVDAWKQALSSPGNPAPHLAAVYFGSRFQYRTEVQESKKYKWDLKDLKDMESYFRENYLSPAKAPASAQDPGLR